MTSDIHHRPLTFIMVVATAVILVVTIVLSSLANTDAGRGLFNKGVGREDSREYPNDIQPAEWTFYIWFLIFVFQLAWALYTITLLFRRNSNTKEYLYYDPPFLPPTFYAVYILGLCSIIIWLFAFDNDFLSASFVCLIATWICLQICQFFSMFFLWRFQSRLSLADMWANIILVQNGIGFFSSWVFVATMVSLNSLLTTDVQTVSQEDAGTISLAILLALFIVYFFFDIFLASTTLRYQISPYLTIIWALSGVVNENWDPDSRNATFAVAILAIAILAGIGKAVAIMFNMKRHPLRIETMCCTEM